jgi:hypothetical protein
VDWSPGMHANKDAKPSFNATALRLGPRDSWLYMSMVRRGVSRTCPQGLELRSGPFDASSPLGKDSIGSIGEW